MKASLSSITFSVELLQNPSKIFDETIARVSKNKKFTFLTGQFLHDIKTAFSEGVANAIRHGHELKKHERVDCSLKITKRFVEVAIMDHGSGFKLESVSVPDFSSPEESGRGIFMMRQLMDEVLYRRGKKKNVLVLRRHIVGADPGIRDLDLLYDISDALVQSIQKDGGIPNAEIVYNIILKKAVEAFGVERASILVFDPALGRLKVVASQGLTAEVRRQIQVRPGEGIAGYVFQHAKPCLMEDLRKNRSGWEVQKKYKSRSFISAPMILSPMRLGQESLGVINMTDRLDGRPFTRRDLKLLNTIANQAAAYLHICRLVTEAKDSEMIKRELSIARNIQQSYLPQEIPNTPLLDMAGWCDMAQSVGGDYYDYILRDPDNLYVVVADVSGHNIASAITMANFRSQLKTILVHHADPGEIISFLNRQMYSDLARHDQFISVLILRFNIPERKLTFCNAGHLLPLVRRKSAKAVTLGETSLSGSVVGLFLDEGYVSQEIPLQKDDLFLFYTDGVLETQNIRGEHLGPAGLQTIMDGEMTGSAQIFADHLKKALTDFRGFASVRDDVTAVVVRVK